MLNRESLIVQVNNVGDGDCGGDGDDDEDKDNED